MHIGRFRPDRRAYRGICARRGTEVGAGVHIGGFAPGGDRRASRRADRRICVRRGQKGEPPCTQGFRQEWSLSALVYAASLFLRISELVSCCTGAQENASTGDPSPHETHRAPRSPRYAMQALPPFTQSVTSSTGSVPCSTCPNECDQLKVMALALPRPRAGCRLRAGSHIHA